MIVKIFKPKVFRPGVAFAGVRYNTDKVDRNKGELMKVANFGPLQGLGVLRPQDYINYLSLLASFNTNVKLPQFHATISAKGDSYSKGSLTNIAEGWLKEMGYGQQPYLIVFHKDTDNNHVHLVSCRVDREGKKISSAYEHVRAQKSMNRVLGYELALQYRFSTRAQFIMILENAGYPGVDPDERLLQKRIEAFVPDKERAAAIRHLFERLKNAPHLGRVMKEKYHIDLVFHASEGKKPYGYSIIDHAEKRVFKGSEVMPLKELLLLPGAEKFGDKGGPSAHPDPPERFSGDIDEIPAAYIRPISIADDVDDEAILGMKRRRKKKARTNTR